MVLWTFIPVSYSGTKPAAHWTNTPSLTSRWGSGQLVQQLYCYWDMWDDRHVLYVFISHCHKTEYVANELYCTEYFCHDFVLRIFDHTKCILFSYGEQGQMWTSYALSDAISSTMTTCLPSIASVILLFTTIPCWAISCCSTSIKAVDRWSTRNVRIKHVLHSALLADSGAALCQQTR